MASALGTTEFVRENTQSPVDNEVLEAWIDEADAEIVSRFGPHPTDQTSPEFFRRRGVLMDLIGLYLYRTEIGAEGSVTATGNVALRGFDVSRAKILNRLSKRGE